MPLRQSFAGLLGFVQLELLKSVGREVRPLPDPCHAVHEGVLEGAGPPPLPHELQVPFHQVRVPRLAQAVVVHHVVLHVPRFWQHPVEPVPCPGFGAAHAEGGGFEAAAVEEPPLGGNHHPVVAAVAGVVGNHGPAAERPQGERGHGYRVHAAEDSRARKRHGGHAHRTAEGAPPPDFVQVRRICGALLRFKPLPKSEYLIVWKEDGKVERMCGL